MKKVIITHMGGPEKLEDISQFLKRIFLDRELIKLPVQSLSGRIIAKLRVKKTVSHYKIIGGFSPINSITHNISRKLNKKFEGENVQFDVKFTHSHPLLKKNKEKFYIFPLYPQYSNSLTGYIEKIMPDSVIIKSWYREIEYLECMKLRIKEAIDKVKSNDIHLLFVAHSLPEEVIKRGDPYEKEINDNFKILSSKFSKFDSTLSYIGSVGFKKWIGPEAEKVVEKIHNRNMVVIYLSMPLDNIEVLYDIDYKLKMVSEKYGIKKFIRVSLPNDNDDFIMALESIIRRRFI